MFLDKIQNYSDESTKLKKLYSKDCKICNGEGVIYSDKGFVNCKCIRNANIHARLICNGMPKKYLNINWDAINDNQDVINNLKNYCTNIGENTFNGHNLFINGNDKLKIMQISCILANDLAYRKNYNGYYNNILFLTLDELTQTIYIVRNSYEQRTKLQKILSEVDILILNYLGDETDSKYEQTSKYLNNLFTERTFNEKINILSSTLGIEEIANKYGANFINVIKHNFKPIKLQNIEENKIDEYNDDSNGYY